MPDRKRAALTSLDASGNGLRIDLFWQIDRYAHKIVQLVNGIEATLLDSTEGTSDDVWPPSPPFQQLSIEEIRPGVEVALLVGMAGKSHWSASIEPHADRVGFIFDVACRLHNKADWLGSSYKLPSPAPTTLQLTSMSIDNLPSSCNIEERGAEALITPAAVVRGSVETVRWKYGVGRSS